MLESHLKYLQIFHLRVAYTIIAPFSGKSLFLKVRRGGRQPSSQLCSVKDLRPGTGYSCFLQPTLAAGGELEFYSCSCTLIADTPRDFLHYLFNTLMCNWNITLVLLITLPLWAKLTILVLDIKGHI